MTIIEKYYNKGTVTVQFDFTRTVVNKREPTETEKCDTWELGFNSMGEAEEYMGKVFGNEKYKRLPNIKRKEEHENTAAQDYLDYLHDQW